MTSSYKFVTQKTVALHVASYVNNGLHCCREWLVFVDVNFRGLVAWVGLVMSLTLCCFCCALQTGLPLGVVPEAIPSMRPCWVGGERTQVSPEGADGWRGQKYAYILLLLEVCSFWNVLPCKSCQECSLCLCMYVCVCVCEEREREGWGACWVVTQHTRYATFVGPINHLRCENMLVLYPLPVNNLLAIAVFLCWVLGHEYNYWPLPMNMVRWIEWMFVSIYWGLWSKYSLGEQWSRTNTLWRADRVEICQEFTWVGSLWSLKCTLASALQNTCRERERERE